MNGKGSADTRSPDFRKRQANWPFGEVIPKSWPKEMQKERNQSAQKKKQK